MNTNNLFIPVVLCFFLTIFCWIEFLYRPQTQIIIIFSYLYNINYISSDSSKSNYSFNLYTIVDLYYVCTQTHTITRLPLNHPAWVKIRLKDTFKGTYGQFCDIQTAINELQRNG